MGKRRRRDSQRPDSLVRSEECPAQPGEETLVFAARPQPALYAYNGHLPQHASAHQWWTSVVNGDELIGFPYEITFGFVRIATNQRLGSAAIDLKSARSTVESWIELPQARILTPSPNHWENVLDVMESAQASGAVLSDAVLASYAIENRATLCSNDADFSRFKGLKWLNPLAPRS